MNYTGYNDFITSLLSYLDGAIEKVESNKNTNTTTRGKYYGGEDCKDCVGGCYGCEGDTTGTECEGCIGCDGYDCDGDCSYDYDYDDDYIPNITNIIDHVIFNKPATIVFWVDGTKTVVKCTENDEFSKEVGVALAILKKLYGNAYYHQIDQVIANRSFDSSSIKKSIASKNDTAKTITTATADESTTVVEPAKADNVAVADTTPKTTTTTKKKSYYKPKSKTTKSTSTKSKSTSTKSTSTKSTSTKSKSTSSKAKSTTTKSTAKKSTASTTTKTTK